MGSWDRPVGAAGGGGSAIQVGRRGGFRRLGYHDVRRSKKGWRGPSEARVMASLSTGVYGRGLRAFAWVRGGRVVLGRDGGRKPLAAAEGEGDSRHHLTWA